MANTQETIADIIAEMRGMGNYQRYSGDHARVLANRLDAAYKRERGDCAKLREALAPFPSLCEWLVENAAKLGIPDMVAKLRERGDKARAALSAPSRNCDVGTAEEQSDRYEAFCESFHVVTGTCDDCPIFKAEYGKMENLPHCQISWAQMPYEEGGAK